MMRQNLTLQRSTLQQYIDALNGGELRVYSCAVPAHISDAVDENTLLVRYDMPTPCGVVSADGVLSFAIADTVGLADGQPVYARFFDANGVAILDCDVGENKLMRYDADYIFVGQHTNINLISLGVK